MTNLVVQREKVPSIVEEWLKALGVKEKEKIEVVFLDGEVILRPQTAHHAELDAWLDEMTKKYNDVLTRLSVS